MVDLGEDEERFESFMVPLTNAFDAIGRLMSAKADLELVGNQEVIPSKYLLGWEQYHATNSMKIKGFKSL